MVQILKKLGTGFGEIPRIMVRLINVDGACSMEFEGTPLEIWRLLRSLAVEIARVVGWSVMSGRKGKFLDHDINPEEGKPFEDFRARIESDRRFAAHANYHTLSIQHLETNKELVYSGLRSESEGMLHLQVLAEELCRITGDTLIRSRVVAIFSPLLVPHVEAIQERLGGQRPFAGLMVFLQPNEGASRSTDVIQAAERWGQHLPTVVTTAREFLVMPDCQYCIFVGSYEPQPMWWGVTCLVREIYEKGAIVLDLLRLDIEPNGQIRKVCKV